MYLIFCVLKINAHNKCLTGNAKSKSKIKDVLFFLIALLKTCVQKAFLFYFYIFHFSTNIFSHFWIFTFLHFAFSVPVSVRSVLQKNQSQALRVATGCFRKACVDHIHQTKVLPIINYFCISAFSLLSSALC